MVTLQYVAVEHMMKLFRDLEQRTGIFGMLRTCIMKAPAASTDAFKFG